MRSLILWLKKLLGMANTVKVQGSKTVARARKGDTGNGGITYRISVWEDGKLYRNDTSLNTDGERIIDICCNKAMAMIGDSSFKAYKCKVTHESDEDTRPLAVGTYWEEVNSFQPIVTPVLLAQVIAAQYIDVDSLYVKHLDAASGDFNSLQVRDGGSITTGAQVESTSDHIVFNNSGLECKSDNPVHGTTIHDANYKKTGVTIRYKRSYTGINVDKTLSIGYGAISVRDDVENTNEYAVFCNGQYKLAIVSSLPSTTDSSTVYIVTGSSKGVYVGDTKIA